MTATVMPAHHSATFSPRTLSATTLQRCYLRKDAASDDAAEWRYLWTGGTSSLGQVRLLSAIPAAEMIVPGGKVAFSDDTAEAMLPGVLHLFRPSIVRTRVRSVQPFCTRRGCAAATTITVVVAAGNIMTANDLNCFSQKAHMHRAEKRPISIRDFFISLWLMFRCLLK